MIDNTEIQAQIVDNIEVNVELSNNINIDAEVKTTDNTEIQATVTDNVIIDAKLSDNIVINAEVQGYSAIKIDSVTKTSTEGLVDTYTITYSDGTTNTFNVTNGATGATGASGTNGTNGVDGYTPIKGIDYFDGVDGFNGIDGANGIDGLNITWKGEYSEESTYCINDSISYDGSSYICVLESTGNLPTNTTYFNLMAQKGDTSEYELPTASTTILGGVKVDGTTININNGTISSVITQYTDEMAQDTIGEILTDSDEIDFVYNDSVPSITANIKSGSIDETKFDSSVNASLNKILDYDVVDEW